MLSSSDNSPNKNSQRTDLLPDRHAPFSSAPINVWKQGLLFIAGNVFTLSLITTIVGAMLANMDAMDKTSATLLVGYSFLFLLLLAVLGIDIKRLLPKFKNWEPYVVGFALGITILMFGDLYIRFVNLFYDIGIGGNEAGIRSVLSRYPISSIFIFGLIGPMCEELTYRVGLFGVIKKWKRLPAYIIAGLIFGFIHMKFEGNIATEFILLPNYIFPGIVLCFAYDIYDLPCSYTAHITNNLVALISQAIIMKQ